ncbi:conserved hypothetical protein [Sphingobacterium multivorum]|uniref:Uncharacterized protein n=1 Tax=Sphingobacterium multivorum TaxID=28454 RepID=A0A653Y7U1_SPHMU|nr:conserved hypothetical protein [Sphingobacterium multivorum]
MNTQAKLGATDMISLFLQKYAFIKLQTTIFLESSFFKETDTKNKLSIIYLCIDNISSCKLAQLMRQNIKCKKHIKNKTIKNEKAINLGFSPYPVVSFLSKYKWRQSNNNNCSGSN